jgi:hypothetical protein
MGSSGVIIGTTPDSPQRLPRGTTRLSIGSSQFLTNVVIAGDTFQISTLDVFEFNVTIKPSAASTDAMYNIELFDETLGSIIESFPAEIYPSSAPLEQCFTFVFEVLDATHFYSIRITVLEGNPNYAMSLSAPTFFAVLTSLDAMGGIPGVASVTATPPIFSSGGANPNITLGPAASGAIAPTTADANASVIWSPFDNAHKALVLQGQAGQTANLQEYQNSAGTVMTAVDPLGRIGVGAQPLCALNAVTTAAALANGQEVMRLGAVYDGATPGSGAKIDFTDQTNALLFAAIRGYTFGPANTGLAFDTGFLAPTTKVVIDNAGNVGIGTTTPAFLLDVNGDANINGKLTVTGAIDPTSLSLAGTAANTFMNMTNGNTVPVSAANEGRIIYNSTSQTFQASLNGGAFTDFQVGVPTLAQVLAAGNTTGANNILVTVGQQIDTAAAGVLNLGNTNATAAGIGNPSGGLSTFQMFVNQGGAALHGSNAGFQLASTTSNRASARYNQYGANTGVPGITGFKSRGANVGTLASVADGDVLARMTAIGVAGDNASIPLAGFVSIQVPTGGTNATWVATDFSVSLVPLAGPINSNRQVFKITSEAAADFIDGTTAPVTAANHGAIRYNNTTKTFQISVDTGAWTSLSTGAGSTTLQQAYDAGQTINESAVGGAITQTPITITNTVGTATDVLQLTKNPGAAFAGNALTVSMGANATGTGISVAMNAASTGIPFEVDPATGGFIRIGTPDAFSRDQIWHTGLNSILRLGADTADGDPASIDSEGIVVYHPTGDQLGRIKADRFGLTRATDANLYYFRVDQTQAFYTSNPAAGPVYGAGTVHWYVNRTSGLVAINNATAGFPVQVARTRRYVDGRNVHDCIAGGTGWRRHSGVGCRYDEYACRRRHGSGRIYSRRERRYTNHRQAHRDRRD